MKFLQSVIQEILQSKTDLTNVTLVLPGKRPVVFIKRILKEHNYTGLYPEFITIDDLLTQLSKLVKIEGIALWLFSYEVYQKIFQDDDFGEFIKWFPTLIKDWEDMLKFSTEDQAILDYMLDDERLKNWGQTLGDDAMRVKHLDFWKKMNVFLPELKQKLLSKGWGTSGLIYAEAQKNVEQYCKETEQNYFFIGFNALTPVEENLIKSLLQWDKASSYFQADRYYMQDERQEAGAFLRKYKNWKEFNAYRPFRWIDDDFSKEKNINVYEVSGNVTQTKILPELLSSLDESEYSDTALVLLDENLLPATLDALNPMEHLNITMGFSLKNLDFSNAVRYFFHIQRQLERKPKSYYYKDVLNILEAMPPIDDSPSIIEHFKREIREKNRVYLGYAHLKELLGNLVYFELFERIESSRLLLEKFSSFCFNLKFKIEDDIVYENVAHFENAFKVLLNLLEDYPFEMSIDTLEALVNQLINTEKLNFEGEPLEGLQIMGLLETRLLNFKNIILLSTNEGKLPVGNNRNTFLPFDVRNRFRLYTYLENDGIYAYHFYRLLQNSKNVFLLYNGLSSGVNTGEKSRFITQIEMESSHQLKEFIIENQSEPIETKPVLIHKTPIVLEKLQDWKQRVSASHLTSYLYDPLQFYFNYVLKTKEVAEVEEEISQRNYGNLVHYSLEKLYGPCIGKLLTLSDFDDMFSNINQAMDLSILELKHEKDYYDQGMNYVHKAIAKNVIATIIQYDKNLVSKGNALTILGIERKIENIPFVLDEKTGEKVQFLGFIDRVDQLNDTIRVIDYKTSKVKKLDLKFKDDTIDSLLVNEEYKQTLQLCLYLYYINHFSEFKGRNVEAGIWSFAQAKRGVHLLTITNGDYDTGMISIKNLILEILNPEIPFEQKIKENYFV